jgi:hypothetical protein
LAKTEPIEIRVSRIEALIVAATVLRELSDSTVTTPPHPPA